MTLVASGAIVLVTLVNCAAVSVGGRIASVLATLKVSLVLGVGVGAFLLADGDWANYAMSAIGGACEGVPAAARGGIAGFGAAMLGAMWAYNGWNEVTYVAGEVKDPSRNLPRAIIGGIGIISTLYVFANLAYFYVLTPAAVASVSPDSAVATEVVARFLGPVAGGLMAAALAMSVFGSLQVVALVSARIPYAMAVDGLFFKSLGRLSPRTRVPIRALWVQAAWAIVLVSTGTYRALFTRVVYTEWIFFALMAWGLMRLRNRAGYAPAYRVWGYPIVPIIFTASSLYIVINQIAHDPTESAVGLLFVLAGLPVYYFWLRTPSPPLPSAQHAD